MYLYHGHHELTNDWPLVYNRDYDGASMLLGKAMYFHDDSRFALVYLPFEPGIVTPLIEKRTNIIKYLPL